MEVFEKKQVPENCSTCLYGRCLGAGCDHADRQGDWFKYAIFGGCPSYWLDQHRFEPVDGRRWSSY